MCPQLRESVIGCILPALFTHLGVLHVLIQTLAAPSSAGDDHTTFSLIDNSVGQEFGNCAVTNPFTLAKLLSKPETIRGVNIRVSDHLPKRYDSRLWKPFESEICENS